MTTFEEEYNNIYNYCDYELDPELIVLKAHLISEQYIERIIRLFLLKGDLLIKNGRLSYFQKLCLAESFGIIPEDLIECHYGLNKLRNKMAHELDYKINQNDINLIGKPMGKTYLKLRKERGGDLKNLLCALIGYICGGLAHYVVEYENISKQKREKLKKQVLKNG